LLTNTTSYQTVRRMRKTVASRPTAIIPHASKKPSEIMTMVISSIDKANAMCSDFTTTDTECMVCWDEVDELTSAYHNAVDYERHTNPQDLSEHIQLILDEVKTQT